MPVRPLSQARWLIVGLGNPGVTYARTRHTLGARVVEALRASLGQPAFRMARSHHARVSRGAAVLAIPTTFMNDSGRAVRALARNERVPLERLLIVHDDKDLAFGRIKLQKGRSAAGHRGVQSVSDTLGSQAYWRLRIGIGAPARGTPTDAYVLQPFSAEEEHALETTGIPAACDALRRHVAARPHEQREPRGTDRDPPARHC